MSVIQEYNFFIDSKYRSNGTNTSPIWMLNESLVLQNPLNYFTASVLSAEIPYSFKTLASPNNKLNIRLEIGSLLGPIIFNDFILIDEGNYNIIQLLDELKLELIKKVTSLFPFHIPDFNFTYDRNSAKVILNIIKSVSSSSISYAIILYWSEADILSEFFGFSYENDTELSYNNNGLVESVRYVSPYNVNCSPITSLYIRSSALSQSSNYEFLVEPKQSISDILIKIPISTSYGSWIMFENGSSFKVRITSKNIDKIDLYLTSLTYDLIFLNNVHFRCHLKIEEVEPLFVSELRRKEIEMTQKINQLQNNRENQINELEQINNSFKSEGIALEQKQEQDAGNNTNNMTTKMKNEFINLIDKQRSDNLII